MLQCYLEEDSVGSPALHAKMVSFLAYLTANSITLPSQSDQDAINTLLVDLDATGKLGSLHTLWLNRGSLDTWTTINVVDPGNFTLVQKRTVIADPGKGWKTLHEGGFDTGYNRSVEGSAQYLSTGVFVHGLLADNNTMVDKGGYLNLKVTGNREIEWSANFVAPHKSTYSLVDVTGLIIVNAENYQETLSFDGSVLQTFGTPGNSSNTAVSNGNIGLMGILYQGGIIQCMKSTLGAAFIGVSVSGQDAAFAAAFNKFYGYP